MSEYPKYQRIMIDVEVEVLDPITAKAFTFDVLESGDVGLPGEQPEWHVSRLVGSLLSEALVHRSDETGVRLVSSSVVPRHVADGGFYAEMTLPEMPRRLDDGSEVMPPWMEGLQSDT